MGFVECLDTLREARQKGLTTPVVLMGSQSTNADLINFLTSDLLGYYNPILAYGEEKAVKDAREAGANGFIMVDLPPEEAVRFREICVSEE